MFRSVTLGRRHPGAEMRWSDSRCSAEDAKIGAEHYDAVLDEAGGTLTVELKSIPKGARWVTTWVW